MWRGRHVMLGVTGGIAAYKAADLVSRLVQAGAEVEVIMTAAATATGTDVSGHATEATATAAATAGHGIVITLIIIDSTVASIAAIATTCALTAAVSIHIKAVCRLYIERAHCESSSTSTTFTTTGAIVDFPVCMSV